MSKRSSRSASVSSNEKMDISPYSSPSRNKFHQSPHRSASKKKLKANDVRERVTRKTSNDRAEKNDLDFFVDEEESENDHLIMNTPVKSGSESKEDEMATQKSTKEKKTKNAKKDKAISNIQDKVSDLLEPIEDGDTLKNQANSWTASETLNLVLLYELGFKTSRGIF